MINSSNGSKKSCNLYLPKKQVVKLTSQPEVEHKIGFLIITHYLYSVLKMVQVYIKGELREVDFFFKKSTHGNLLIISS